MADNIRTAHKRNLTETIDVSRTKPIRKTPENPEPPNVTVRGAPLTELERSRRTLIKTKL